MARRAKPKDSGKLVPKVSHMFARHTSALPQSQPLSEPKQNSHASRRPESLQLQIYLLVIACAGYDKPRPPEAMPHRLQFSGSWLDDSMPAAAWLELLPHCTVACKAR